MIVLPARRRVSRVHSGLAYMAEAGRERLDARHELLESVNDQLEKILTFQAYLNAHGMYETIRFVLRLSLRNHELIETIEANAPLHWADAIRRRTQWFPGTRACTLTASHHTFVRLFGCRPRWPSRRICGVC